MPHTPNTTMIQGQTDVEEDLLATVKMAVFIAGQDPRPPNRTQGLSSMGFRNVGPGGLRRADRQVRALHPSHLT